MLNCEGDLIQEGQLLRIVGDWIDGTPIWLCRCACGNEFKATQKHVEAAKRRRRSFTCGHKRRQILQAQDLEFKERQTLRKLRSNARFSQYLKSRGE